MIQLIKPNKSLEKDILLFKYDFKKNNENTIPGSELLDKIETFDEWLEYIHKNSNPQTVSPDWVVSDCFLAICGGKVVGIISLRHELNDFLKDFGHIGYSVSPRYRGNKIATKMLKMVLEIAKNIGLCEVQLSSEENNIASIKTIENNGGTYIRSCKYLDKTLKIFIIKL